MTIIIVSSGHTSRGVVVSSGSEEIVLSGGVTSGSDVEAGGTEIVSAGGSDSNATLRGRQLLSGGTALDDTVASGGIEYVFAGGTASDTTVSEGGLVRVSAGGSALGTRIDGGEEVVFSGGSASGAVVRTGGSLAVDVGGAASGVVVSSGGLMSVVGDNKSADAPHVISTTVLSGGKLSFDKGGTFSLAGSIIVSGASVIAEDGVTLSGGVISGDLKAISATVEDTVIAGGEETIQNATALDTIISSGGTLVTVGLGTGQNSYSRSTNTTVLSGGRQIVENNGITSGDVVSSGGLLEDLAGGSTVSAVVDDGGLLIVSGGAEADSVIYGTEIVSSGYAGMFLFGSAVVNNGGIARAYIQSGGSELISAGGAGYGGISKGGVLTVLSGGQIGVVLDGISSWEDIGSGGSLVAEAGAVLKDIEFDGGTLDLAGLDYSSNETLTVTTASTGLETLKVTNGGQSVTIGLFGQYAAAGFGDASDGHGGTLITYTSAASASIQLVPKSC